MILAGLLKVGLARRGSRPEPEVLLHSRLDLLVDAALEHPTVLFIDEFSDIRRVSGFAGLLRTRLQHHFQDIGLREAIDGGWVIGPRIVAAGYAIGATGGHCDDNALPPSWDKQLPSVVNSPGEARAKVRWLHKYGAQVIKICATGGVFTLGDSVGGQQLSEEEMRAIADEAHMLHLKVAAHAHGD